MSYEKINQLLKAYEVAEKEYDYDGKLLMDIKLDWNNDTQKYIEIVQEFNKDGKVVETYKNEFHPKDLNKWRMTDMRSIDYNQWILF